MVLREKKLEQHNSRLEVVNCASAQKITIYPNQYVNVRDYIDQDVSYPDSTVIKQEQMMSQYFETLIGFGVSLLF